MCDYSLDLIASRPAKVGDKLITTKFHNSMTRGFAAIGEPNVAVCLLPGTEVAFDKQVQYERFFVLFPSMKHGNVEKESGALPADQCRPADGASRCTRVPRRRDRVAHPAARRPARNRAAVAGSSAVCERTGRAKARFVREVIGLSSQPYPAGLNDGEPVGSLSRGRARNGENSAGALACAPTEAPRIGDDHGVQDHSRSD
jgi:hypothetical protein